MQIVDTFATHIQERIEPVVKVADRRPVLLLQELRNLIVTSQWEQYLRQLLDAWANASERADNIDPGIWISGFFGSGKSLLLKVLGVILEGGMLGGESVHGVFLDRLAPNSPDRSEIKRLLTAIDRRVTTSFVGGNLHALQSTSADSLALIAFKLFADQQGYTRNWAFAWAVEYYIDQAGKKAEFQQRAEALTGKDWEDLVNDTAFNITKLMQAAAETLPDHFTDGRESVAQAMSLTTQSGITPNDVIDRFVRWCRSRDGHGCVSIQSTKMDVEEPGLDQLRKLSVRQPSPRPSAPSIGHNTPVVAWVTEGDADPSPVVDESTGVVHRRHGRSERRHRSSRILASDNSAV